MLDQPPLELLALPALRQVGAKDGNGSFEGWATEKPGIIVPSLVAIRTIDPPPKAVGEVAQRERVAHMQLDLQEWLATVGSERSFADDEPHNVPDVELSHGAILAGCSNAEQSHVARARRALTDEPRGTYKQKSPHLRALQPVKHARQSDLQPQPSGGYRIIAAQSSSVP